ncbi:MAG: CBASS oligonucleotide cyclase [Bacteroidota bacterium]
MNIHQHSTIHKRCKQFVQFIAPEKDKIEDIKKQSAEIRERIKKKAEEDGKIVAEMPYSGSFGKNTGLRRYLRGSAEVEGMDIDLGFILEAKDDEGNELGCQIDDFESYARACYPDSDIGSTKSSATISFKSTKRQYDLVPLLKTDNPDVQKLIRTNGEERQSSIKKHAEFIKSRNRSSHRLQGVVVFNHCVRLIKWWRYHKQSESGIFGNEENDEKVPSFLLDLLCAHAYDKLSVTKTYPETLARWFALMAHVVRNRKEIIFTDYIKFPRKPAYDVWLVADPVDTSNNVVANWHEYQVDELAEWLESARDRMTQAIRMNGEGDDHGSLHCLVEIFGKVFKHNVD